MKPLDLILTWFRRCLPFVLAAYVAAIVYLSPILGEGIFLSPTLGLWRFGPIHEFVDAVLFFLCIATTGVTYAISVNNRASIGTSPDACYLIFIGAVSFWGSVLTIAVVALACDALGIWGDTFYFEDLGDVAAGVINLRGISPKSWPIPVIGVSSAITIGVAVCAVERRRRRQAKPVVRYCLVYFIVASVATCIAWALLRHHSGKFPLSYTGAEVCRLLGSSVILSCMGSAILVYVLGSKQKNIGE